MGSFSYGLAKPLLLATFGWMAKYFNFWIPSRSGLPIIKRCLKWFSLILSWGFIMVCIKMQQNCFWLKSVTHFSAYCILYVTIKSLMNAWLGPNRASEASKIHSVVEMTWIYKNEDSTGGKAVAYFCLPCSLLCIKFLLPDYFLLFCCRCCSRRVRCFIARHVFVKWPRAPWVFSRELLFYADLGNARKQQQGKDSFFPHE